VTFPQTSRVYRTVSRAVPVGQRIKLAVSVCMMIICLAGLAGSACSSRAELNLSLSGSGGTRVAPSTGVNTNFFNAPEKLSNRDVWKAVEEAGITVMRFPGGTRGTLYDWSTGTIRAGEGAGSEPVDQGENNTVPMDDFMSRAKAAGVSVSYVLNITDSSEKIRRLAQHWESTNAPVRWVEVGNEYYLPSLAKDVGGTAGYLRKARQALSALRAGGYQGPVGLVVAPERVPGRADASFRTWNEQLANADTTGFSAIILHYYPSSASVGFDQVFQEGPSRLIAATERLRQQFPNKQIWVTEWNLGPSASAPRFNTLWHALFDLQMLKAMFDSRVDLACYHVLTGRGWELLGPDHRTLHDTSGDRTALVRRVPYFAFQMVDKAWSDGATHVTAREADRTNSSEGFGYMAFRTDDELRIVAWTTTEATVNVHVRMDESSPKFLGGTLLHGSLDDTNGSWPTLKDSKVTRSQIEPVSISSPRLEGPGAVLLRFALDAPSGHTGRGTGAYRSLKKG
jgi:hypothetical protein